MDDEQFLKDVRAAGFKPIPRRSGVDHLAFALTDVVALLCIFTWARERIDRRLVKCTPSIKRWDYCHDGWRPGRYV